ncbi:MAG: undecaprenyl-phosphate galactose phosphotransferase WbaP [Nitrospirae bacterium]|nr:undecaprenyl-phosphate galactose phosphotransferase WbaP [Nitrospirota bacterium]
MKRFFEIATLILLDVAGYYVSLSIAWYVRERIVPAFFTVTLPNYAFGYYLSLWWIPVSYVVFIAYLNVYTGRIPFWDETKKLLHAITLAFIVLMAIVTLGKFPGMFSRVVLVMLWFFSLLLFPVMHLYGKRFLFRLGLCKENVLVLGAGRSGKLIVNWLGRERHIGYEVLGFLDDDPAKRATFVEGKKVFGEIRYYTRFVRELKINTIIIAMPSLGPEKISAMAFKIQQDVKHTMIVPDLYGVALLNTELLHLFYEELFLLKVNNNLKSLPNMLLKRSFDLALSIMALPFLFILIAVIGILIKLQSRGPVIYSHERIGKGGRSFKCYKFRTMVKDAEDRLTELLRSNADLRDEWEKYWKITNDPRVTRIGAFLRKTSLDELPQIFNVLKGEMSLIGARPYLWRELYAVADKIDAITKAPPGITGLWQVSGRNNTTYEDRIRLDIWYTMNWSLWLDLFILLRTVKVVICMKGVM